VPVVITYTGDVLRVENSTAGSSRSATDELGLMMPRDPDSCFMGIALAVRARALHRRRVGQ
jgi:hypothetical protein